MAACASCGADLPTGARFCAFCGTAVDESRGAQERRVVTIVFADLVGFTERSDHADPEDVRRTLLPFHRQVREDLERFGGTLDKFIGDAVLGVFGAPVAHEDDPLRAVRAAVRILRSIDDLRRNDPDLQVRVAVETGEAVVSFGSGPQAGEAVAGDVVNTASRMQSLAPNGSVVIGETTLRAVRDRFEVEALPPSVVKGKSEPLAVWRVVAERAEPEAVHVPFVGRRSELAALFEAFDETVRSGSAGVVTVLAEPGVGKSRLLEELGRRLGDGARWLTGTCPPYGEGVTFTPVEETVRAIAGLGPSDDATTAVERLEALAARAEPDPQDRRWLASTLQAVLALGPTRDGSAINTDEIAQAWARVLSAAAEERPLLLAIEDLHWAAAAFVEVLRATARILASRPVLILASARPEVLEEHPGWGADGPNASTLAVGALEEAETRELLGNILPEGSMPDAAWAAVLERSGGNPLYAIEFARMLEDGGAVAETPATPASIQALISARLDAIPASMRTLALDAAALGEEVWPEALARLADRPDDEVRAGLEELGRRGLLQRRPSSLPDLQAWGFAHAVIREVAYGRLPRATRARLHLAAATWLEATARDRAEEWSESLSRHYASAAELGAAANETEIAVAAREPALRWLVAAGDRAGRVDPAAAFAIFERALALAPEPTRAREELLRRSGFVGRRSGLLGADEVLARTLEGLEIARAAGDEVAVGESLTRVGTQFAVTGQTARARAAFAEAVDVLERHPPGRELARACAYRAEEELFMGDTVAAAAFADRALALLDDEGDEVAIIALHIRGDARCSMGDLEGGLADLGEALRLSEVGGAVGDVVSSRNYLAEWRWAVEGPAAGLAEWEMALELAERRNVLSQAAYTKAGALAALFEMGDWDQVLAWSEDLRSLPAGRLDPAVSVVANAWRTRVLLSRGRRSEVTPADELVEVAERIEELHALSPALVAAAAVAMADGDVEGAGRRLAAFESATEGVAPEYRAVELVRAVRLCIAAGRLEMAERLVASVDPRGLRDQLRVRAARAMLAEQHGDPGASSMYAEVAERLRGWGDPFEEAMALLGHARLTGEVTSQVRARALLDRLDVVD